MVYLVALALLCLTACSQTISARATMLIPARVPVRAFPTIWVAGDDDPVENYLLDRLANHLAHDGRREVRRVATADLEPAREAGAISATTVVVLLKGSWNQAVRTYWDNAPVQYCGYYGCMTDIQSYLVSAIEVSARADLTVYEGPTARVLQQEHFESSVWGEDAEALRQSAFDQLAVELERAVDVLKVRPRFELYKADMPEVKAALSAIGKGDWAKGREHLERAAKQLGGKKKTAQARVWYNLGMARWASPGPHGLTREAYAAAHRALAWAQRLEPAPHHQRALVELDEARKRFEILEGQRSATKYNFELAKRAQVGNTQPPPKVEEQVPFQAPSVPAEPGKPQQEPAKPDAPAPTPEGSPAR